MISAYTIKDNKIREVVESKGIECLDKKIKRLRVYKKTKEDTEKIGTPQSSIAIINHGDNNQHQKLYSKDNNHLVIWFLPMKYTLNHETNRKRKTDYIFTPVKTLDLNKSIALNNFNFLKPHPAAKIISRIYIDDTIAVEKDGIRLLLVLKSININDSNNRLEFLKAHSRNSKDAIRIQIPQLAAVKFRKVYISAAGLIKDNGPILK